MLHGVRAQPLVGVQSNNEYPGGLMPTDDAIQERRSEYDVTKRTLKLVRYCRGEMLKDGTRQHIGCKWI